MVSNLNFVFWLYFVQCPNQKEYLWFFWLFIFTCFYLWQSHQQLSRNQLCFFKNVTLGSILLLTKLHKVIRSLSDSGASSLVMMKFSAHSFVPDDLHCLFLSALNSTLLGKRLLSQYFFDTFIKLDHCLYLLSHYSISIYTLAIPLSRHRKWDAFTFCTL